MKEKRGKDLLKKRIEEIDVLIHQNASDMDFKVWKTSVVSWMKEYLGEGSEYLNHFENIKFYPPLLPSMGEVKYPSKEEEERYYTQGLLEAKKLLERILEEMEDE